MDKNKNWIIPLYKIYTDDEDLNLITKIVKRGNQWALGPEIEEFENALKNLVGIDYCVTLNSGTSALHASLIASEINSKHEVIVPSFSFISTANSVLFVGATPQFADIEENTFGLDPKSIEKSINSKTKAIIPMDYGGQSCHINEIKKISDENDLVLIEDAAESLGSSVNSKKVGSVSKFAIFSFCGNKVLTTGEGGAIVTSSKKIYEKLKLIRSHGRMDASNYFINTNQSEYVQLGYNWRMSSITATLGLSQLSKLDKIISMRQKNAKFLLSKLSKHPEIKLPIPKENFEHIYQMFTIRLPSEEIRNLLQKHLTEKKIVTKVYFDPIHETSFYKKFTKPNQSLPITNLVSKQVLTLPLYPNMTSEELNYLVDSIDDFFESHSNE